VLENGVISVFDNVILKFGSGAAQGQSQVASFDSLPMVSYWRHVVT